MNTRTPLKNRSKLLYLPFIALSLCSCEDFTFAADQLRPAYEEEKLGTTTVKLNERDTSSVNPDDVIYIEEIIIYGPSDGGDDQNADRKVSIVR